MCAQLRQLFALEMGVQSLADLLDEESLTRARFAPMKRLLSNQDENYLHALIDAGEIKFHGIFDSADVDVGFVNFLQGGIERGGFA